MVEIIHWPASLLKPRAITPSIVPFSRSGGRSLGGVERTTKSDRGFWRITMDDIRVARPSHRRTWNAIRSALSGKTGLVAIPVWSFDSAPYASDSCERESEVLTSHDDGTTFDDGTLYTQGAIDVEMASYAALGATVVTLKLINASTVTGIRFSYQHAMYDTGPVIEQTSEDTFRVSIIPAIRQAIPAGSTLECDLPTLLCHLADDRGMDLPLTSSAVDSASIDFVEAVDFWNDLALGLI